MEPYLPDDVLSIKETRRLMGWASKTRACEVFSPQARILCSDIRSDANVLVGTAGFAVAAVAATPGFAHLRREEFIRRKFNAAEHIARVVAGGDALLFRDAEVIGRDQHLDVAHNLHNGEHADGDVDIAAGVGLELAAKTLADAVRDAAARVAAAHRTVTDARREADRLRDLHRGLG